jgi:beta-glucanase (GH16 family)
VEELESRIALNAPGTGWNLVFDDEFTGSAIDTSKWTIGKAWSGADGTRGDGLAYITNDDVIVSNGTLKLHNEKRDVVGPQTGTVYHYTTGYIQTSAHFRAAYGYFEIRAKVPTNVGQGIWPAFWMLGNGWPPEMDIAEWITSGNNFHQGLYGMDRHWHDYHTFTPFPTGFHTYSMQWSPGQEIYYVDGQPRLTVNGSYVPSQGMYLILSNGINTTSPPTGSTRFPNDFEVDYVRVYQQAGAGGTIVNPDFEAGTTGWTLSGNAAVVNYNERTGFKALRMNGGTGYAQQVITGLLPNSTYTLSGWDRVSSGATVARIGVKNYGDVELWADNRSTGYTPHVGHIHHGPGFDPGDHLL